MSRSSRQHVWNYLRRALALVPLLAVAAASRQSADSGHAASSPKLGLPDQGAVYLDIITDSTGAVARVEFLNKIPPEIQELVNKKILGHHFGVPNHCYRRHVE